MKQSCTLLVIIVFAFLCGSFTINRPNLPATGKGVVKMINKWKNTTWVNPWSGAKKFTPNKSLTTARVYWHHNCGTPSLVYTFDVTLGGIDYEGCALPSGTEQVDLPTGSLVTLNLSVHPTSGDFDVYVEDTNVGFLYVDDTRPYASYGFYVEAGHEYNVWTHVF